MAIISQSLELLAASKLEQEGVRLTTSRKTILGILESSSKPITVTDIAKKAPALVQSSIYRNLSVLENAHLVSRIVNENDFAFFELDEHVIGHHHHLRCTNCGEVLDIELSEEIEVLLEKTAVLTARKHKFSDVEHHLDFSGICKNCS